MNAASDSQLSKFSTAPLFARSQGAGVAVMCLHSSSGSHAQWRELAEALAGCCEAITPDLYGHGRSPAWPVDAANSLEVDAHAASALLPDADDGFAAPGVHLVGHSYGGAVAPQIALREPRRVRSLTLYEPVAFGLMRDDATSAAVLGEIEDIAGSVEALVRRGDLDGAARVFVSYWGGAAAWEAMGPAQRTAVFARIVTVPRHFAALFRASWNARLLASLTMPVLLIHGAATRAPARRVADLLGDALPHARRIEVAGAGHLGPMTHAPVVVAAMLNHLQANGLPQQRRVAAQA
ncbi:MAG: alpha/beta fold hydrolase [Burkholderiales bacterium]